MIINSIAWAIWVNPSPNYQEFLKILCFYFFLGLRCKIEPHYMKSINVRYHVILSNFSNFRDRLWLSFFTCVLQMVCYPILIFKWFVIRFSLYFSLFLAQVPYAATIFSVFSVFVNPSVSFKLIPSIRFSRLMHNHYCLLWAWIYTATQHCIKTSRSTWAGK